MAELILPRDLTAERLRELLDYDPATGVFRRRVSTSNRIKVGDISGTQNGKGYLCIRVGGKKHQAHRLAWLYTYGRWPSDQIDHINRNRSDNRLENLREASSATNMRNKTAYKNSTSGHVGVYLDRKSNKWRAHIRHLGKLIYLGLFTEKTDALAARQAAEILYWGGVRAL